VLRAVAAVKCVALGSLPTQLHQCVAVHSLEDRQQR
jgi:hypothetical protein